MVSFHPDVFEPRGQLDKTYLALLVSRGARYMQAPGQAHVRFLKRGLRYLRGKVDLGLLFDFSKPPLRKGLYGFF